MVEDDSLVQVSLKHIYIQTHIYKVIYILSIACVFFNVYVIGCASANFKEIQFDRHIRYVSYVFNRLTS